MLHNTDLRISVPRAIISTVSLHCQSNLNVSRTSVCWHISQVGFQFYVSAIKATNFKLELQHNSVAEWHVHFSCQNCLYFTYVPSQITTRGNALVSLVQYHWINVLPKCFVWEKYQLLKIQRWVRSKISVHKENRMSNKSKIWQVETAYQLIKYIFNKKNVFIQTK